MEDKIKYLESELAKSKKTIQSLQSKLESFESNKLAESSQQDGAFWSNIEQQMLNDTDYIKRSIKNGTVSIQDTDKYGRTLLHFAAWKGNFEIAKLCLCLCCIYYFYRLFIHIKTCSGINLGADINAEDTDKETPLFNAVNNNHDHIEQTLLFAQTKSNVGDRIKNISQSILKQNSIIENVTSELSNIGTQSKQIFLKTLTEVTINIITKKIVFSDDLLVLCWKIEQEKGNELKSELWRAIERTSKEIIDGNSKRDWYWLKQCLLPSNV